VAYLSRETVRWLTIWLEHAKISEGPIFRRLIGRGEIGDALHPGSIVFNRDILLSFSWYGKRQAGHPRAGD
jgi:hypothetical protein